VTLFYAFLAGLVAMLIVGGIAHFAIGRLTWNVPISVGAFCFTLGFAVARYSGSFPVDGEGARWFCRSVGSFVGLMMLWYWWFKRPMRKVSSRG
jgi:hypothetical protein